MKKDNNSGEDRGINVRKHKRSMEDWAVDCFAYGMAAFLMISIILPFMQVVTISMSPASVVNATGFHLFPTKFDFSGYRKIATDSNFWHSYFITIMRTVIGTGCGVLITVMTAYPLSKLNLPYRRGLMLFVVFTMYFSGGMIPKYLLIKNLHLTNNFLVYILPCMMTGFALIITRNFFYEYTGRTGGIGKDRWSHALYGPVSHLSAFIQAGYGYNFVMVLCSALEFLDGQHALCDENRSLCPSVCPSDDPDQWTDGRYGGNGRCGGAYGDHEDGGTGVVSASHRVHLSIPAEVFCKRNDGGVRQRLTKIVEDLPWGLKDIQFFTYFCALIFAVSQFSLRSITLFFMI